MDDYRTFDFCRRGTYYRRHRELPIYIGCDDECRPYTIPGRATISRWGWQRDRFHRPNDAYLSDEGVWLQVTSVPTSFADGEPASWAYVFAPISNMYLHDRYPRHTRDTGDVPEGVTLHIGPQGGLVDATTPDGTVIATGDMTPEDMRRALGMAPARRGRKPRAKAA